MEVCDITDSYRKLDEYACFLVGRSCCRENISLTP